MEQGERIRVGRRALQVEANKRWRGFQPNVSATKGALANLDGSIPRPTVAVVIPRQRLRYEERSRLREAFDSPAYRESRRAAERQIGATLDFADLPPNEQALKAGRPVVRIVTLGREGMLPEGFATGFLVAPQVIITNHHVFRTADEALGTGAHFLYEHTQYGVRSGLIFELDPATFFLNHKGLDYALVAVRPKALDGAPLSQFQFLPLIGVKGKIRKGDPVNIIQHPKGGPKVYTTVNNELVDLRDDGFLAYWTDTDLASSGSPCFNEHWEVIGLHHCGVPYMEDDQLVTRDGRRVPVDAEVADSDLIWVANEGIRVSAIVASLKEQRPGNPSMQQILQRLIETTDDPLRLVVEKSPIVVAEPSGRDLGRSLGGEPMAQNLLQFSGPVTINMSGPATVAPAQPSQADAARSVTSDGQEPSFREKALKFDEDYNGRSAYGYKEDFLEGWKVPAPTLNESHDGTPVLDDEGKPWVIPYYHYSLVMNLKRRLLAWAASNVDYSDDARRYTKTRKEYGGESWRLDPRVALRVPSLQIEDAEFYAPATKIDRGHIVRREDCAHGRTAREAEYGNSDTYHWTNCTPQSEGFNQAGKSGLWGQFEEHIQRAVTAVGGRMSVFAGPVLNPDDPEKGYAEGASIQVPMEFWKVIMCVSEEDGKRMRRAYGFIFDQSDPIRSRGFEKMDMSDFEIQQQPLAEISRKTGVVFHKSVLAADVLREGGHNESLRGRQVPRIKSLEQIVLR